MRPYLDKAAPAVWSAAQKYSASVTEFAAAQGIDHTEAELMKVRASQLNGCAFCLDLHSRDARKYGVPQQKLDVLGGWREADIYTERECAVLSIAEAATRLPLTEDAVADLEAARNVLGEDGFAAAEWIAVTINTFNRISILSRHPIRARGADGHILY
ncbi:carboxymuconolactone decarboxylase family protein [Jongsikchunia kroppenstedtii]|uniref:carboxymuconolactone decarboxylase family protein n=1 Tax=Jongsikchunia kroppenstedtii TaxID=1121721 RepID=UPI00035F2218|nr:carboxymuconolactone decarboxylase family protein [Jongsikchunia kroppenstedtii]